MSSERERTAHHEAGHAVAAYLLERGFGEVSIVPDEARDSVGHVRRTDVKDMLQRLEVGDYDDAEAMEKDVRAEVMVSLAGVLCEIAGAPPDYRMNHDTWAADRQKAVDLLTALGYGDLDLDVLLLDLTHEIDERLKGPGPAHAVGRLAAALLKHEFIGQQEARRIIREALEEAVGEGVTTDGR